MSGLVTIKDIARELKLAPSTVSRALNDHPDINEKTRKLVKETAQRLGYRINRQAQGFRMSRSYNIGVVVPFLSEHFFSNILSGIQEIISKEGYQVFVYQTNDDAHQEAEGIDALIGARVDGLLLSASQGSDSNRIKKLLDTGVPTVLFDRVWSDLGTSSVETNDHQGCYLATRHLLDKGCRKIAHLAGPANLENSLNRRRGYEQALKEAGIEPSDSLVYVCDFDLSRGPEAVNKLLKAHPDLDGIVSVNDELAVEAILHLNSKGIDVPGAIKVVGFGDFPIARIVTPALTTMRHQPKQIGNEAARLLLDAIKNKDKKGAKAERKIIDVSLVERASS